MAPTDTDVADRGFSAVLTDPVAGRLLVSKAISEIGDFVGLAALLVLAYRETGSVIGPAAVFAARTLPAVLVGTVFSNWLDRPPRRGALVALEGGFADSLEQETRGAQDERPVRTGSRPRAGARRRAAPGGRTPSHWGGRLSYAWRTARSRALPSVGVQAQ